MILVVGGTGDLGGRVVRRLTEAGEPVACLVRRESARAGLPDGVRVLEGDLTRPAGLTEACAGMDTVVCTATAIGRLLTGARGPSIDQVDRLGVGSLVTAAEAAGVSRFVYLSYASPEDSQGSPIERAKIAIESRLRGSSVPSTILRPDAFHEVYLAPLGRFDLVAGKVGVLGTGDNPRRWVSTEDVAALTVAVCTEDDPPPLVEFGGPDALTRNETIALAERITGRRLRRQALPRPVVRLIQRVTARWRPEISSIMGLGLMMDLGPVRWDDRPLRDRGIEPRTVADFLTEQARALAG